MATDDRPPPEPVALFEALAREPERFDFLRALRLIETAHPGRPRLGAAGHAADEPVRLGQQPSTRFAPSTLARVEHRHDGVPRLLSYFFGLLGPQGPLPLHLTDYAWARELQHDDPTLSRFLDCFNHRMLSLFYRAWAQAQPTVSLDRPREDRFGVYVGSLCGLGMPAMRGRDAMPDAAKLHFAGHLGCPTRHRDGLSAILGEFLDLPVEIEEFVGHWLTLPDDDRSRLGAARRSGELGRSIALGARVWDRQHRFRVRIGPMGLADYQRLLPGGDSLNRLVDVVRNYLGDELAWDLNLVLARREAPPVRLGQSGRLGWTAWLRTRDRDLARDGDQLRLDALRWLRAVAGSPASTEPTDTGA